VGIGIATKLHLLTVGEFPKTGINRTERGCYLFHGLSNQLARQNLYSKDPSLLPSGVTLLRLCRLTSLR
jgi:hypothetical protein